MKKHLRYHGECCASRGLAAKTLRACGPSVFGRGTSLGTTFNMIPPQLFQIMSQYTPSGVYGLIVKDDNEVNISLNIVKMI